MSAAYIPAPSPDESYPSDISSGMVILFEDPNWTSTSLSIKTGNAVEGAQYSIVGTSLENEANWVAFNLPVGVVMTLLTNPTVPPAGQPYNFAGAGVCVDLIGNGEVQTVDLAACGAENAISAYVWRNVKLSDGLFQMFDGLDYTGGRSTFFLGEWGQSTTLSLVNWWICDRAASLYFGGLTAQSFTLFDGGNGEGSSVTFAGWLDDTAVPNLGSYLFNDKAASWSWKLLPPLYANVESFTIQTQVTIDPALSVTSTINGTNSGLSTLTDRVTVSSEESQSLTLSVTDSAEIGFVEGVKFTSTITAGVPGDDVSESIEISCEFSQTYSYTTEKQTVVTQTIALEVEQEVNIPENCDYNSTLSIQFANVPPTNFSTNGSYYYDQPVPGSHRDEEASMQAGKNIYLLEQAVTGQIGGGIATNTISSTVTTPLT
ncbi:hypothetical protein [Ideonella sp.]|uniref:hypothetical protein n=1 Tax=Ideonella sp. TaxID=1929293 RepID=UPI003BB54C2E